MVELLADRHGAKLRKGKERSLVDEVTVDGKRLALAIPQTYMNLSGEAVAPLVRRHGITDLHHLVIVHDELDLPVGRIQVKVGGGLAGNNGLKSVKAHLHTDDFVRVRIGIGKPAGRQQGTDHVLKKPGKADRLELDVTVVEAADAVEVLLAEGPAVAMNRFNTRPEPG